MEAYIRSACWDLKHSGRAAFLSAATALDASSSITVSRPMPYVTPDAVYYL